MNLYIWVIRKFRNLRYKKKNQNKTMTIISQNCIGGILYSMLGLKFMSPTINMFIEDESFVKLVENFEYYMRIEPHAIDECYVEPLDPNVRYPKIGVDDIEICCLHYKSCEEAIETWNRRKKRINYNNVYVVGNSWNMHENKRLIERLANNGKYKTVIFTYEKYDDIKNCVYLKGDIWKKDIRGIVRPDIMSYTKKGKYRFEELFDFLKWFN